MLKLKAYVKKHSFIFSGLLALVVLGIIIGLGILNNPSAKIPTPQSIQSGPLTNEAYQAEAKAAVTDYELYLKGKNSSADIVHRKEQLLGLKISREWQNLHLDLVMMADSLQALSEGQSQKKNEVEQMLKKLYADYPWLKN